MAWPGVPRPPRRAQGQVAGWPGVQRDRQPGIEVELLSTARTPVPLPACLGDGQDSGQEKECTAISQRLLHQMKVAVRAAKQDVG